MTARLLDVAAFKAAERAAAGACAKDVAVFHVSVGAPKAFDESRRAFRFCFSDSGVDRMQDTITASGWRLANFMRSPTALFAHDSSAPPIGRAANVAVEDTRLMGDIEFAPPDVYEFADTIYRLVKGGYLNAVSVGFQPIEYDWTDDDDREWGMDFKVQELLEISVVPVPANPRALIEARAKGVDTRPLVEWAERMLDGGGKIIIPKGEIERLRKAAKEPAMAKRARAGAQRRDGDGMGEGDPADGGAIVGNCGRPLDDECGMKDVAQCAIHGQGEAGVGDEDAEKRLAALVAKTVREEVAKALKGIKPRRRDAEEGADPEPDADGRPDVSEDHEKCIRMAHMHMKAMGDALDVAGDHYDNAMDQLDTVKDALDATPPANDGDGAGDDPEAEKAARLKRARELRRRVGA